MKKLITTFAFIICLSVSAFAQETTQNCPQSLLDRCTDAANRLVAAEALIDALKLKVEALEQRLELEKQRSQMFKEAFDLSRQQRLDYIEQAKIKDEIIKNLQSLVTLADETITKLKNNRDSFWSKVGKEVVKILIFVGVGSLIVK